MTVGQFEAVSAEVLEVGDSAAQAEAVAAEVLTTVTSGAQMAALAAEALITMPVSTTVLVTSAEVLIPSLLVLSTGGNVYDFNGLEHEVFLWDGAGLVPVTVVP